MWQHIDNYDDDKDSVGVSSTAAVALANAAAPTLLLTRNSINHLLPFLPPFYAGIEKS
jgi:hypothetical protein